jgi:hypothetical protein
VIIGAHLLLYSGDADADRAFFRDVLKFPAVNAGHGWLYLPRRPPNRGAPHGEQRPEGFGQPANVSHGVLLDVRGLVRVYKGPQGQERQMFGDSRRTMGNMHYDPVVQRRRDWPVSTKTSHGS